MRYNYHDNVSQSPSLLPLPLALPNPPSPRQHLTLDLLRNILLRRLRRYERRVEWLTQGYDLKEVLSHIPR